ncbi:MULTISPECIES: hypothetical protein [Halomonadaceae]|uniref:hypothetical protein n=1 Tax=Halomonadaceae TaxID=28256 RepID=UPI0015978193|nr:MULTISPECIES: hypothetical protein [Halomonas]QJQ96484.1 hypothetical protein HIO72_15260 [Halomonas sp. PA5]
MVTSDSGNASGKKGQDQQEKAKARELVERDNPAAGENPSKQGHSTHSGDDKDKVYKPSENVDNQKASSGGTKNTGHNTSIDEAPYSGKTFSKGQTEEEKRNINDKADDASSDRRNG